MRENGVLVLRDDQRMLGLLLHAPRGPFYSPKAVRSCWIPTRKAIFADLLPFLAQPTVGSSGWLAHQTLSGAHRTLSGAHRTVRCPQPTVGWGHTSCADCAADRCIGGRWLNGQSGAPPDSPVNYSRTPPTNSREWPVHQSPAWRTGHCPVHHRIMSGAPPDSPVHPD
jgi:hypothetical protein